MLWIFLVMLVILALAGLVVTFVAFPHRGEEVPAAPWLGEAMTRAAEAMPTLENTEGTTSGQGTTAERGAARETGSGTSARREEGGSLF